jgi:hypothetical protein
MIALKACRTRSDVSPTDQSQTETPSPVTNPRSALYLRRWISHQAVLYNDLLQTIAAAPRPHTGGRRSDLCSNW